MMLWPTRRIENQIDYARRKRLQRDEYETASAAAPTVLINAVSSAHAQNRGRRSPLPATYEPGHVGPPNCGQGRGWPHGV
jgi:hypothetical protein